MVNCLKPEDSFLQEISYGYSTSRNLYYHTTNCMTEGIEECMSIGVNELFSKKFISDVVEELDGYEPRDLHPVEDIDPREVPGRINRYKGRLEHYEALSDGTIDIEGESDVVNSICNSLHMERIKLETEYGDQSVRGCRMDIYISDYGIAVECKYGRESGKLQKGIGQCVSYEASYDFIDSSILIMGGGSDKNHNSKIDSMVSMCDRADIGLGVIHDGEIYLYRGSFEHKLMGIWDHIMC